MGGGDGGASRKLKNAAKKILVKTCGSFCHGHQQPGLDNNNSIATSTMSCDSAGYSYPPDNQFHRKKKMIGLPDSSASPCNKNLCTICLESLNYSSGGSPGQAIFTAQCSHAFHFACISSNVRHGSVTCPVCRAHWTQLPRNLNLQCSLLFGSADPVLQILDDSIANSRVHRRSFLRSARYDDDDPIEPDHHVINQPRLNLSLLTIPLGHHSSASSSSGETSFLCSPNNQGYLCVKLAHQPATDLVLVASPNGPHLRLMKQAMAVVVFSLRSVDRLAIATYSSSAARLFPLRRMTSYGKRSALQVIDRLFHTGHADPMEGLQKGVKILGDRAHRNTQSCILHLTDGPYHHFNMEVPVTIHQFNVGYGFGPPNGLVMRDFEEFLARTLGGAISDIQMRIGEDTTIVRIGELRGGEERNIPIYMGECGPVCVEYSYVEGGCIRTGEIVVGEENMGDGSENGEGPDGDGVVSVGGRMSSVENWDHHDPFMARRWAKHLHGYRL